MDNLLSDFYRKRQRAQTHLETVRQSIRAFGAELITTQGKYDHEQGGYVFRADSSDIDPNLTLSLGDVVYNARAALNYLVTALIRSNGGDSDHRGEFPLYGGAVLDARPAHWSKIDQWWESDPDGQVARCLAGSPEATKGALKQLQPFFGVPRTDPSAHPLFHLQLLSNRDKHRRLNFLSTVADIQFVDQAGSSLYPGQGHRIVTSGAQVNDDYSVFLKTDERNSAEIFLTAKSTVHLNEPPELVGDVVGTLEAILDYLDSKVVPTVKQLLSSR